MSTKLWVAHETPSKTFGPTRVSIDGCSDVADFLKEIKKKFSHTLGSYDRSQITLFQPDGTTEIDVRDSPSDYLNGNTSKNPLVVKTATVTISSHFMNKREMSAEVSCQKYLDAIAKRLAEFYEFDYRYQNGATIGDVLEAKDGVEGEDWNMRLAIKTHYQIDYDGYSVDVIRQGQPLSKVRLPDIYTREEWDKISKFNKNPEHQAPNRQLLHLSNGKPYIIIPRSEFNPEMISFFKNIGVKASLFSSPDVLEVKAEDFICI